MIAANFRVTSEGYALWNRCKGFKDNFKEVIAMC